VRRHALGGLVRRRTAQPMIATIAVSAIPRLGTFGRALRKARAKRSPKRREPGEQGFKLATDQRGRGTDAVAMHLMPSEQLET